MKKVRLVEYMTPEEQDAMWPLTSEEVAQEAFNILSNRKSETRTAMASSDWSKCSYIGLHKKYWKQQDPYADPNARLTEYAEKVFGGGL